jgi:hypothetical protein
LRVRGFTEKANKANDKLFYKVIEFLTSLYEGLPEVCCLVLDGVTISQYKLRKTVLDKCGKVVDPLFLLRKITNIFENYATDNLVLVNKGKKQLYSYKAEYLWEHMESNTFSQDILIGFKVFFF